MPELTPKQELWLTSLGATAAAAKADLDRRAERARALAEIEVALGPARDKIREDLESVRITLKSDGVLGSIKEFLGRADTIAILEPGGDPMQEVDTWHDVKNMQGIAPADVAKIHRALDQIIQVSMAMRAKTTADGKPLYATDADLARDLWEPLVREGVIPENLVIDKYSEVARTFAASSELYEERLQEYSKTLTKPQELLAKFELPMAIAVGGLKVASAALTMEAGIAAYGEGVAKISASASAKEIQERADIISSVALCLSSTKKAADAAVKEGDLVKASDAFLVALKAALTPAIGKETATFVTDIAGAAVRTVPMAKALHEGNLSEALEMAGKAIASGMAAGDKGNGIYQGIGEIIEGSFSTLASAGKAITAQREGKPTEALKAILEGIGTIAKTAAGQIVARYEESAKEGVPEEDPDREKKLATIRAKFETISTNVGKLGDLATQAGTAPIEVPEIMRGATEKFDAAEAKRLAKAAAAAQARAIQDFLDEPDPEFENMLLCGFAEADTDAAGKAVTEERRLDAIETMMAEVQRQQKIFDLAKTITTGGLGAVAKFVPGVSIAAVATEMMFAFAEAAKKGRQLVTWISNVEDAKAASTVQLDAMMNRNGLAKKQVLEAGITAALKAVKLVGESLKVAGHLAPVGVAISAGADGGEALMGVAAKVVEETQMASAWATYKQALETPKDRKLARAAFRGNPTLSKYAMAYGALKEGNRVAQEAMKRCGLNAKTLSDPGTNVTKVVAYLELVYKEDPKLLRARPVAKVWYPGTIELTLASWTAFYRAATTKAEPLLARQDVSGINAAFGAHDKARKALLALGRAEQEARAAAAATANDEVLALLRALSRYKPVEDGLTVTHKEMAEYAVALSALCESCRAEYQGLLA